MKKGLIIMRAIVIGLGSMGRRRIRLLKQYDSSIHVTGIDTKRERREQAKEELGISSEDSIKKAFSAKGDQVDYAFVCTSPLSHSSIIRECLEYGVNIFTEINLIDEGYEDNIRLADEKSKVLFLSSTFLYRKEIQYIKGAVKNASCPLNYAYHTGQYLPDWHPWENYKDFFASKIATNGCRELMAIEFPWIIDTFGNIERIHSTCSKNSSLNIDFPDNYQVMFEHVTGHKGVISVDITSRKAVRNFELWGERLYLTWDGTPCGLCEYDYEAKSENSIILYDRVDKRADYSASIIEDAYMSEVKNFIRTVQGKEQPRYSFHKDKNILALITSIETRRC